MEGANRVLESHGAIETEERTDQTSTPLPAGFALVKIVRREHPDRDLSTALRFGRDDKGFGGAYEETGCSMAAVSPKSGWPTSRFENRVFRSAIRLLETEKLWRASPIVFGPRIPDLLRLAALRNVARLSL
jgi:hypothetical protein